MIPETERLGDLHVLEEYIATATTPLKKAKFVLSSSLKLESHLQALKADFGELKAVVDTSWRSQYPGIDINTSSPSQKRMLGLAKTHESILREAKRDREETKALHTCCSKVSNASKLEMNLLEEKTSGNHSKSFHIFIPWSNPTVRGADVHLEVCAEILDKESPLEADGPLDFLDACKIAERAEHSVFWTRPNGSTTSSDSQPDEKRFWTLRRTSTPLHSEGFRMWSLCSRLPKISLAERYELAYKVVESGLLLLGTSWLSALNSTTLMRFKVSRQKPKYILEVKDNSPISIRRLLGGVLRETQRTVDLHTFVIGAILVEIALRGVIRNIRWINSSPELLIADARTERWSSLPRVVSLVKEEMGTDYSEAVQFCLQDPVCASNSSWMQGMLYDESWTQEEIYIALLDLFYENVLIK